MTRTEYAEYLTKRKMQISDMIEELESGGNCTLDNALVLLSQLDYICKELYQLSE